MTGLERIGLSLMKGIMGVAPLRCRTCGSEDPERPYVIATFERPEPHECEDGFHESR